MKNILTLTNEQVQALYGILSTLKLDLVKNRNRWKFLECIEEFVISYEKALGDITRRLNASKDERGVIPAEIVDRGNTEVRELAKTKVEYVFSDREVFMQAKSFFEQAGAGDVLEGHKSKMYKEIEDALLNAKQVEE